MKEISFRISSAICMMPITRAAVPVPIIFLYWLIRVRRSLRVWNQNRQSNRSFQKLNFPSAGGSTFHYIQSWTELNP